MSAADVFSCRGPRSPQHVPSQRLQRTLVAFQYALLVLSGIDSAGAIYLLLSPGSEATIAGASPILTAVSPIYSLFKLLNAETPPTSQLCQSRIYFSIRS